ncbi:MAG: hypothetical protein EOP83_12275 [Verrucomicrobiaceae bacterium]|nr:MAG: hypothetical protein EOP83_12275 [Verrucomicrobiaceae bacterium]
MSRYKLMYVHRPHAMWEHRFDVLRGSDMPSKEEIDAWCLEHIGKRAESGHDHPTYRWYSTASKVFWVRHQNDAFEFRMRWS